MIGLFIIVRVIDNLDFFLKIADKTPFEKYVYYFLYEIPFTFNYLFPMSVLFATISVLGKMHTHNEVPAIYGSGLSLLLICYPTIIVLYFITSTILIC